MSAIAIGLIEVSKISYKIRNASGGNVINPLNKEKVKETEMRLQTEFIRTEEIKSFRKWEKFQEQETIEGDFTIIYFKEDPLHVESVVKEEDRDPHKKPRFKTTPTMLIRECFRDFGKRLGAIPLEE